MATKYQQVLAVISKMEKGDAYPSDVYEIFAEFADEAIEHLRSGIQVKQKAAVEKVNQLVSLFKEMAEQDIVKKFPKEHVLPALKEAADEMQQEMAKKMDEVLAAYEEMKGQ